MSAYVSLYRRYRPQAFGDVVGQGHITRTLQNAIEAGRVAHAYLFCGPRGTGKTTTARLLAKALNCVHGPTRDPCGVCPPCERIAAGSALDVIEVDAASNRGIDDIRDLREKVKYAPAEARYKVYVIDECHMLTTEAFNALLKTLEEPPPHVLFVLATTDPQKVPATILSRCQRMDFRRGTVADLRERLQTVAAGEALEVEDEALTLIARAADGSWRDALSILEQIVAFGDRRVTAEDVRRILGTVSADLLFQCAEAIAADDAPAALQIVARLSDEGKDIRDFLRALIAHFRNLLLVGAAGGAVMPDGATPDEVRVLSEQAQRFSPDVCLRAVEGLSEAEKEMRRDSQHRLILEIALLRLVARRAGARQHAGTEVRAAAPMSSQAAAPAPPSPPARPRAEDRSPRAQDEGGAPPRVREATGEPASPAPAPAPAAPSSAPGVPPGLDDVLTRWPLIVERVGASRQRGVFLRGVLRDVRPGRVTPRELFLWVRPGHNFHREQLEKPEHQRPIAEAVRHVLGVDLAVRVEMERPGEESPGAQPGAAASSPVSSPQEAPEDAAPPAGSAPAPEPDPYDASTVSVKDVLDLFQGRVVQSKGDR